MVKCLLILFAVVFSLDGLSGSVASPDDLIYGYECLESRCVKVELNAKNFQTAISLPVCRIFCGESIGTLLPKPTGHVRIESYTLHVDRHRVHFKDTPNDAKQAPLWRINAERFMALLDAQIPDAKVLKAGGYALEVSISIANAGDADSSPKLALDTDESYGLSIVSSKASGTVTAQIQANSYFGARHGLETLSQLIVYDDIRRELQIVAKAEIHDRPQYKWRGILLDTSRNFYSVKSIKRTLEAMAMVKLNTFHWHITDSHSFPFQVKSQPSLYKLGAYSPRKVYTHEDISEIVEYGRVRGIRVMPEFDAPAHVGEGWQHKNMTVCFNAQPWKNYCVEPPCGQLNPTVDELYPVLEDIYREMFDLFDPDVFHMGGDEVSINCWNSSQSIRKWMSREKGWANTEADFLRLWGFFQTKVLERVDRVAKADTKTPIILWTSRLTDVPFISEYLDKNRYIIQIWTTGTDPKIMDILKRGHQIIVSNYDALYFDCGGAGWVKDGNNWCSPYIGWQKVYNNNLETMAGRFSSLVLGAEATIWSEQIDESTLDARLWPRASALAERLWSNPKSGWREAEFRMLAHRQRLVDSGIAAEPLQPEWCSQNENQCPIDAYTTK